MERDTPARFFFAKREQLYHCKGVALFLKWQNVCKLLILGHITKSR
jgi:hypothetical protein